MRRASASRSSRRLTTPFTAAAPPSSGARRRSPRSGRCRTSTSRSRTSSRRARPTRRSPARGCPCSRARCSRARSRSRRCRPRRAAWWPRRPSARRLRTGRCASAFSASETRRTHTPQPSSHGSSRLSRAMPGYRRSSRRRPRASARCASSCRRSGGTTAIRAGVPSHRPRHCRR